MRTLKRRLQQLFIASAVVGAGSVVACSAAEQGVRAENHLDHPIYITIGTINFGDSKEEIENYLQTWKQSQRIEPGQSAIFMVDETGMFNESEAAVALGDYEGSEWRFWLKTNSVENSGCVFQVTQDLINFLDQNHEKTRELADDKLTINDSDLMRPESGESFCGLTPVGATQTAVAR